MKCNFAEVLKGAYAIMDDYALVQIKATIQLLKKLEEGEQSAREKGWLTADEVEVALGGSCEKDG